MGLLGSIIIYLAVLATGIMCQQHMNRRNLTYDQYMKCVQHILVEYGDDVMLCKEMMDELQRYQDDPGMGLNSLEVKTEMVVRKVTDSWP